MKKKLLVLASIVGMILTDAAQALDVPIPAAATSERIQSGLQQRPKPVQLKQTPAVSPLAPAPDVLGPNANKISFVLKKINLKGIHVFTEKQLLPLYQDKLNKKITVTELQAIADKITQFYHANHYILSQAILVPQKIKDGIVTIQVLEGYVAHINVIGMPRRAKELIQAMGDHVLKSSPLRSEVLEENLLLINDLPGVSVKAVLEPSKTPGAADINLVAQTVPVNGFLSYDNYNTRYTGPHEITTALGFNSMVRPGDQTQFDFTRTSVFKELYTVDVFHETPIGTRGAKLKFETSIIETDSGFTLKPFDVIGRTKIYSVVMREPLIRSRDTNFTLRQGFNYLDSQSSILGTPSYFDHIRTFQVGAIFNNTDRWKGNNSFTTNLTQGLPLFGSTPGGAILVSRQGASSNFTKVTLQATRLQGLFGRFSLLGIFSGQYSCNPLLTAEQFGFGGSSLGRGYNNSEIIGDKGIAGSVELHMDTFPGLAFFQYVQFYGFYDVGKVWSQPIPAVSISSFSASAASTGVGAQLLFNKHLSANTFLAKPLTRKLSTAVAIHQNSSRPQFFFGIIAYL